MLVKQIKQKTRKAKKTEDWQVRQRNEGRFMNTEAKAFEVTPRKCVFSCRLEKRLATRRARLAELRQKMEEERENQAKNDPEAMKAVSRGQVSWHFCGMHVPGALLFLAFRQSAQ